MAVNQDIVNKLKSASTQPTQEAPTPAKQGGLAEWLPTAGSIAAPLIAGALAPETGGLSLAALAGLSALGAGAGEVAKQKAKGEKLSVPSVAKEAAIGAVGELTGGLLGKGITKLGEKTLPKLAKWSTDAAYFIDKGIINPKVVAKVGAPQEAKALTEAAIARLPQGSAAVKYEALQPAMQTLEKEITDVLAKENPVIPAQKVTSSVESALKDSGAYYAGDAKSESAFNEIQNKIAQRIGKGTTVSDLLSLKRELANTKLLKSAFVKDAKEAALDTKEQMYLDAWYSLDNIISENAPAVKNLTKQESVLFSLAPGLAESSKGIKITPLGIPITVPSGLTQVPMGAVSTGLKKVGAAEQAAAGKVTAAGKAFESASGQALTRALGLLAPTPQQTAGETPITPTKVAEKAAATGITPDEFNKRLGVVMLADLQKTGGKNISALQAIGKMLAPTAPTEAATKLTETQQARKDVSSVAQQALDKLNTGKIKTGWGYGKLEPFLAKFGAADKDTYQFQLMLNQLKGTIAKARAGTSFTPNEERLLESYTPLPTDSYQQLQAKLTNLVSQFGG